MFGPGESLICYSHNDEDVKNTLLSIERSLQTIRDGIKEKNLHKMLEGNEIKSVMTF